MTEYLKNHIEYNSPDIVSISDEIPLWSAPFGLMLLDSIKVRRNMKILDLGCGQGFPVFEICQRLGSTSLVYGIDECSQAIKRCEFKKKAMNISNAVLINEPFRDGIFEADFFDLIVSNNGINNMQDQDRVYHECHKICKKGGELVFTFNLPGTMMEFYECFAEVLKDQGLENRVPDIIAHIRSRRKSIAETETAVANAGFDISFIKEDMFTLNYLDGTAMLNHFFIKLAFLEPWRAILNSDASLEYSVFKRLEQALNRKANEDKLLRMSVPFACFVCRK